MYLAVSLFVSLLGATSLSRRLSEETIGIVQPSWYWSKGQIWAATKSAAKNGKTEEQGRDDEGGLRIVVFGGRDIATPDSAGQEGKNNKPGWTEILCQEVRKNSCTFIYILTLSTASLFELYVFCPQWTRWGAVFRVQ